MVEFEFLTYKEKLMEISLRPVIIFLLYSVFAQICPSVYNYNFFVIPDLQNPKWCQVHFEVAIDLATRGNFTR